MISRFRTGLAVLLLVAALLITACQEAGEVSTATATVSGGTPAPNNPPAAATQTLAPVGTSTPASTATPEDPLGANLSALKGQTIEFWHPWQGDVAQRVEETAADFNKSNEWGITVKVKAFYSSGALYDALDPLLAQSGAGLPQVVAATQDQLASWVARENILDLTEYVKHPQTGLTDAEVQAFNQVFWAQELVGGKQVGLPALRDARVIFYNESWAKDLGFTAPPKTPAEFKKQACAAAQKNNTSGNRDLYGTGGWLVDSDALTTLSWLNAFGANPVTGAEGQPPYKFESKEAENSLAFLRGMVDEGCAWIGRVAEPHEYFSRRMTLFYTGSLADVYPQTRWQTRLNSKDNWTILPFPSETGKPVVLASGYSYALLRGKPESQLAGWLFARWMETPRVAAKLTEALPSIPVSSAVAAELSDYRANFPWNAILPLSDPAQPAPGLASWREARRVVEDASWQVYHLPADGLPQILPALDEGIQEILK